MFKKLTALLFVGLLSIAPLAQAQFGGKALNILEKPTIESVGDGEVTLSWTEVQSTVTEGASVPSYKIFYSDKPFTGAENTYLEVFGDHKGTVKDLENGVTYNFTVVAVDTNGSESPDFSPSANATPQGAAGENGNGEVLRSAGTVALVRADVTSATEIRMVFNSNIVLPAADPTLAFTVHEKGNPNALVSIDTAVVDPLNKRMVVLTTAPMQTGVTYLVVAGVNVANEEGDYVKSGVIDRAEFTVNVPTTTNPITGGSDTTTTPTDSSTTGTGETTTTTDTSTDTSTEEPIISPVLALLDVRNLTATVKQVAEQMNVLLRWSLPTSADGASEQRVYQSTDGTLFSRITSLDPSATDFEIKNLTEGTYWFKVTRANQQGQESEGVLSKVVALPASGPGLLIFLGGALGAATMIRRKQF